MVTIYVLQLLEMVSVSGLCGICADHFETVQGA
jgi:hypothetical protein